MEATSLCSSSILPLLQFSPSKSKHPKMGCGHMKKSSGMVSAIRRDSYEWHHRASQLVDENMIVLRKRIHEMKMVERNYEPPADWMEWEKQLYTNYDEIICRIVGLLQSHLMNSRPSLALGMLALITLSVPASTAMVLFRFMEVAKGVLSFVHFS